MPPLTVTLGVAFTGYQAALFVQNCILTQESFVWVSHASTLLPLVILETFHALYASFRPFVLILEFSNLVSH